MTLNVIHITSQIITILSPQKSGTLHWNFKDVSVLRDTVEALVSDQLRELEKVVVTRAGRLREYNLVSDQTVAFGGHEKFDNSFYFKILGIV